MSRPIVLDDKRRASFSPDFRPGDTFVRSVNGNRVVFEKGGWWKRRWSSRAGQKRAG